MQSHSLDQLASLLVADGRGILAADESVATLTGRLEALGIPSTGDSRRRYREMLFTTPALRNDVSGAILYDETLRQEASSGTPMAELLDHACIVPGIKVDLGARPLARTEGELITEGLDGLRERLEEYRSLGARFAKWRAVFKVTDAHPSSRCIGANAHALARYAALCQEEALLPIVEPEVLMDGAHTIERCEEVTSAVLLAVFRELVEQGISLESMLLKPNMVIPGYRCPRQATTQAVAESTLRCLLRHVPAAVPGVVFLSGGQDALLATMHLDAINRLPGPRPWKISFSYGRALQDAAMEAWRGLDENVPAGQKALAHWAQCNSAASQGKFTVEMHPSGTRPKTPVGDEARPEG